MQAFVTGGTQGPARPSADTSNAAPSLPATDACIGHGEAGVSMLALQYAASWLDGNPKLSMPRLYRFNSAPRNPVHIRLFSDPVSTRQYLIRAAGLDRDGNAGGYGLTISAGSWLTWRSAYPRGGSTLAGTRKVYVTAKLDYLPIALHAVVRVARSTQVVAFKLGADYANLRRPDRIVIYTRDRAHAEAVVGALRPALDDVPADALPFAEHMSAAIFTGLDPLATLPGLIDGARSWRGWLCRALAEALHQDARYDPVAAVDVALEHARLLAVDPRRRSDLEIEGRLWLQVAASEMRQEERRKKSGEQ